MGHEERFPPLRLSAGYGFRKETIAGMRCNGRDAPIPDLPNPLPKQGGSTKSGQSLFRSHQFRCSACADPGEEAGRLLSIIHRS